MGLLKDFGSILGRFSRVPICSVYRGSVPRVKRPRREADHSSPSAAELRMDGAIPLLLPCTFMAWTARPLPLLFELLLFYCILYCVLLYVRENPATLV